MLCLDWNSDEDQKSKCQFVDHFSEVALPALSGKAGIANPFFKLKASDLKTA